MSLPDFPLDHGFTAAESEQHKSYEDPQAFLKNPEKLDIRDFLKTQMWILNQIQVNIFQRLGSTSEVDAKELKELMTAGTTMANMVMRNEEKINHMEDYHTVVESFATVIKGSAEVAVSLGMPEDQRNLYLSQVLEVLKVAWEKLDPDNK